MVTGPLAGLPQSVTKVGTLMLVTRLHTSHSAPSHGTGDVAGAGSERLPLPPATCWRLPCLGLLCMYGTFLTIQQRKKRRWRKLFDGGGPNFLGWDRAIGPATVGCGGRVYPPNSGSPPHPKTVAGLNPLLAERTGPPPPAWGGSR